MIWWMVAKSESPVENGGLSLYPRCCRTSPIHSMKHRLPQIWWLLDMASVVLSSRGGSMMIKWMQQEKPWPRVAWVAWVTSNHMNVPHFITWDGFNCHVLPCSTRIFSCCLVGPPLWLTDSGFLLSSAILRLVQSMLGAFLTASDAFDSMDQETDLAQGDDIRDITRCGDAEMPQCDAWKIGMSWWNRCFREKKS